jgi:hypothetical protein
MELKRTVSVDRASKARCRPHRIAAGRKIELVAPRGGGWVSAIRSGCSRFSATLLSNAAKFTPRAARGSARETAGARCASVCPTTERA